MMILSKSDERNNQRKFMSFYEIMDTNTPMSKNKAENSPSGTNT